jgi:hypothetical protein
VKHPSFQYAAPSQSNKQILRTDIEMRGNINPQSINSMVFYDKGTDGISNAKLYYTNTPTFTTANLLGTVTNSTAAGHFEFTFAAPLQVAHGTHYF